MLERYSTESLSPGLRIRRWCEFGSSTLSRLAVKPYQPSQFRAQLVRATLGEIGITHMVSTAAIAESAEGCVGEWVGSGDGALGITYYRSGRARLAQGGQTLQLAPGDIVIRDLRRRWVQDSAGDFSLMTVKVPVHCLDGAFATLQSCVMVPLRAGDPRTSLLSGLIENLGRVAFDDRARPGADPVERLLRAAVEISFSQAPQAPAMPRGGLPPVLIAYVATHLADAELSVAGLARDLGLGIRSVQRLFHQAGTTPRAYILARRLEAAAERLRAAGGTGRVNITDLAMSLGFNDPGYFSRVFHEEFGLTPSAFLRRHRYPV